MEKITGKKIGELFVELGFITKEQLARVLEIQEKTGGYLGEILLARGLISEDNFSYGFTLQFGQHLPFINLKNYNIQPEAVKLLSSDFVERYRIVPVEKLRDILTIAVATPENLSEAIEKIHSMVDVKLIEVLLTTHRQINEAIIKYYF